MSGNRYIIDRRVSVVVKDKQCECRVSISTAEGSNKCSMHFSICDKTHMIVIRKLQQIAESEIEK